LIDAAFPFAGHDICLDNAAREARMSSASYAGGIGWLTWSES